MILKIKELFHYRQMLKSLVLTDLRTRYKGSFLGFLWTFVNPLLLLIVYTMVFSTVMRINIDNYAMFVFVGLLPWIFFSTSIQSSAGIVVRQSGLVKKIYFPRIILPLSSVGAALINYLLSLLIMIPALYFLNIPFSWNLLYFPMILLIQLVITTGLSIIVASLNVFFRDLEHILSALLMVWFYFTPILYLDTMIPKEYRMYFDMNPIKPIIDAYQKIFFYQKAPDFADLLQGGLVGLIILVIGVWLYEVQQRKFAEEL